MPIPPGSTPTAKEILGPHVRAANPHEQYATRDELTAAIAALDITGTGLQLSSDTPQVETVGVTGSVGTSTKASPSDHRHAMPSTASGTTDGFMSASDKAKLDSITVATLGTVTSISGEATVFTITNPTTTPSIVLTPNGVTNAKLAQMATKTIKGNNTGGTANAADLTLAQFIAMWGTPTGSKFLRDDGTLAVPAGAGTVTSVGLALPAIFTVSGSPVTGAGTLTAVLATQVANTLWAGPTTGADAAPTFRAIVDADIPATRFSTPGAIGNTVASTGAFTTVSATGQITSTLAIGTAPFAVTSTTNVANLNASSLSGATFATPGSIGSGTPGSGAFTSITASTTITATGVATSLNLKRGTGTPEGTVVGVIGDLFQRTDGGTDTAVYRKESGSGNTGWVAIAAGSGGGGITGTLTATRVPFATGASTVTDIANFTFVTNTLRVPTTFEITNASTSTQYVSGVTGSQIYFLTGPISAPTKGGGIGNTIPGSGTLTDHLIVARSTNGSSWTQTARVFNATGNWEFGTGTTDNGYVVEVGGTLNATGVTSVTDTTEATSVTAASLKTLGGLAIGKRSFLGTSGAFKGNVIMGVQDGTAAVAGQVGEIFEQKVGVTSNPSSGAYAAFASIALTAGDWLISAVAELRPNGATFAVGSVNEILIGTTNASNTGTTAGYDRLTTTNVLTAGEQMVMTIPAVRVNINAGATYYLNLLTTYTLGTPQWVASITATRMR